MNNKYARLMMLIVVAMLVIACIPATAQSDWRLFGGFSYLRIFAEPEDFNAIGWGASVTQYMPGARWFGATAEGMGVYKTYSSTETTPTIHTAVYTALFGPSFAYRKNPRIEPFAHLLLGGIGSTSNISSDSVWAFGYALGGGADFKISKLFALRGQADWIRSTFPGGEKDRQNSIRVMGGMVFRIGG
jgi:opacity protein-like surface antigen